MIHLFEALYKMIGGKGKVSPSEKVEEIFKKFDRNEDGRLSMEEFMEGCKIDDSIAKAVQLLVPK